MNYTGAPMGIAGVDNVAGYQTFEITINAAQKAAWGNTINTMIFVSANYYTAGTVISIDDIRIVKASATLSAASVNLPGTASVANVVTLNTGTCG